MICSDPEILLKGEFKGNINGFRVLQSEGTADHLTFFHETGMELPAYIDEAVRG